MNIYPILFISVSLIPFTICVVTLIQQFFFCREYNGRIHYVPYVTKYQTLVILPTNLDHSAVNTYPLVMNKRSGGWATGTIVDPLSNF